MTDRIYLDHAATTPVLPAAREAIARALEHWANPSSAHTEGRAAHAALEAARRQIADTLCWQGRIIFTSGASEALAIALTRARAGRRYISTVEHDAVLRAAPEAIRLEVDSDGIVQLPERWEERPLVAVQHANNETGIIQPIDRIAASVAAAGGLLLVDCAQTAGKIPLPEAHMIAIAGHKFGSPPGIGALLIGNLDWLEPVGGQEQGYRPGTEGLPSIAGMAAALAAHDDWIERAARLRARLEDGILAGGGEIVAGASPRVATIGAYRMPGVPSHAQLIQFDMSGIAISAGSACSSGSLKPSRILGALGWDAARAAEVVRVSFGPSTTEAEIDRFLEVWTGMAKARRAA